MPTNREKFVAHFNIELDRFADAVIAGKSDLEVARDLGVDIGKVKEMKNFMDASLGGLIENR